MNVCLLVSVYVAVKMGKVHIVEYDMAILFSCFKIYNFSAENFSFSEAKR